MKLKPCGKLLSIVSLLVLSVGLGICFSGCLNGKAAQRKLVQQRRTYAPELSTAQAVVQQPRFAAARLRSLRLLPPCDSRNFIVKRAGCEMVADFYQSWLSAPAGLLRAPVGRYLAQSALFEALYDQGAGVVTPLGVEVIIEELLLDYSAGAPCASATVTLLVLDEAQPEFRVVANATGSARTPFDSQERGAAATALSAALSEALATLCNALRD